MTNRLGGMAAGVAILAAMLSVSGCASTPEAQPAPARPMMVGGPCTYATQSGTLTVVGVDAAPGQAPMAHLQFTPDGQNHSDGAGLEASFASGAPSPGQSLPGGRQTETHGTCTPLSYYAVIGGIHLPLTITARPN
jgi:hypothetical protein